MDRSNSHASEVGRAISSTPRAFASSHTSGMIGSCPLAPVPTTSCGDDQGRVGIAHRTPVDTAKLGIPEGPPGMIVGGGVGCAVGVTRGAIKNLFK